MSYLVLARKYRPQSFDQVVEQSHVTKTLSNAILSNRVAHAILLSGPRGTGKTTIARIIAKSMNCVKGPTPSPCNECRSCVEITSGHSVDVFEIDGASNNSVDQIRELRENIRYMPAHSTYKIYIIDEVHMLSTAAFNALLKTLEEPPAHVMFIFATTEVHKIPVTILSRCQRHELRRLPLPSLQEHLVNLCRKEGIDIPVPVLETITKESGGSMRDALSLLDQLLGSMPEGAGTDELLSIIGVAGRDIIHSACEAIIRGNIPLMLEKIDEIYSRGLDLTRFYHDVTAYMRDLVLAGSGCGQRALQINEKDIERITALASEAGPMHLAQLVEALINSEQTLKFATNPRIAVEMIFMRLIHTREALSVGKLIEKIDGLKKSLAHGHDMNSGSLQQAEQYRAEYRQQNRNNQMPFNHQASSNNQQVQSRASGQFQPSQPYQSYQPSKSTDRSASSGQGEVNTVQNIKYNSESGNSQEVRESLSLHSGQADQSYGYQQYQAGTGGHEEFRAGMSEPAPVFPEGELTGDVLNRFWKSLLRNIEKKSRPLYAVMSGAKITRFDGNNLVIEATGTKFALDRIQSEKSKGVIRESAAAVTGRPVKNIEIRTLAEDPAILEENRKTGDLKQRAMNNPVVTKAVEMFGGKIIDIKIIGTGEQ